MEMERAIWQATGTQEHYVLRFADDGLMAFEVGVRESPQSLLRSASPRRGRASPSTTCT